jgi:BirA family transcriptional regulator, biotin operon repressor / biotin---[acetyl-CoA-carboxylase] ligase
LIGKGFRVSGFELIRNSELETRYCDSVKGVPLQLQEVQSGLATRRLGTQFHYFHELDSTNTYARRLAQQGAPEGEVVIAEQQTRGRGRLGRSWVSPPYVNVYFSVLLRPVLPPVHAPQITLTAAVALADSVAAFISQSPVIKWPNDILVSGQKLAGILTESSCTSERIEFVILGIGVNVNFPRELMGDGIREQATSLMEAGQKTVSREALLRRLIQDLDRCYGILQESGFGAIAPRWEAYFGHREKKVRVDMGDGVLIGKAKGIDRDGALIVEDDGGVLHQIIAGDVTAVKD